MKKFLIILCYILFTEFSYSQNQFEPNVNKIIHLIERNIKVNEINKNDSRIEFFIYDISINQNGNILEVHTLILDSLCNSENVLI